MPYMKTPSGDYFEFDASKYTPEQAYARAQQAFPTAFGIKPEEGFVPSFKKATKGYLEQSFGGAAEVASPGAGRAALQRNADDQSVKSTNWADVEEAYKQRGLFGDDKERGGISTAGAWLRDTAASSAPQMLATMGGARVGATAGSMLAGVPGAIIGGIGGAALAGIPAFTGQNFQAQLAEQQARGVEAPLNRGAAVAAAVPQTALDALSSYFMLGKLGFGKVIGKSVEEMMGKSAAQLEKQAAIEAQRSLLGAAGRGAVKGVATEMPTEVAQQVLERYQAGQPLFTPDALNAYKESAMGGGALGILGGGAGGVSGRGSARAQVALKDAADAAEKGKVALAAKKEAEAAAAVKAEEDKAMALLELDQTHADMTGQVKEAYKQEERQRFALDKLMQDPNVQPDDVAAARMALRDAAKQRAEADRQFSALDKKRKKNASAIDALKARMAEAAQPPAPPAEPPPPPAGTPPEAPPEQQTAQAAPPVAPPVVEQPPAPPVAPTAPPASHFVSTKRHVVSTEDSGDVPVTVHRLNDGSVLIREDERGHLREFNADFAKDKTDEELLQYSYEPEGHKGSAPVEAPAATAAPVAPPVAPVNPLLEHLAKYVPPGVDPISTLLGPNNDPTQLVRALADNPELAKAIAGDRKVRFPGAPDAELSTLWKKALRKQIMADVGAAKKAEAEAATQTPIGQTAAALKARKVPKVEDRANMKRPIDAAHDAFDNSFGNMMSSLDVLARGEYTPAEQGAVIKAFIQKRNAARIASRLAETDVSNPEGELMAYTDRMSPEARVAGAKAAAEAQSMPFESQAVAEAHGAKGDLVGSAVHRIVAAREARGQAPFSRAALDAIQRHVSSMVDALVDRARRKDESAPKVTTVQRAQRRSGRTVVEPKMIMSTEQRVRAERDAPYGNIYGKPWEKGDDGTQADKFKHVVERFKKELDNLEGPQKPTETLEEIAAKNMGPPEPPKQPPWFTGVEEAQPSTQHIERTAAVIETVLANRNLDADTRAALAKAQTFLQENGIRAESRVERNDKGEIVNRDTVALSKEDRLPRNKLLPARIPEVLLKDIDAMVLRARRGLPTDPNLGRQVLDHIAELESARDQTAGRFGEQGTLFGEAPMTPRSEWEKRRIASVQQKAARNKIGFTGSQVEALENQIKTLDAQFEKAQKKNPAATEAAAKISAQLEDLKGSPSMLGGPMQDVLGRVEAVLREAGEHQDKLAAARAEAEDARKRMVNEFYGAVGESEAAKSMQSIPETIRQYRMLMNATTAADRVRSRQFAPILNKLRAIGAEKEELRKALERRASTQRGETVDPAYRAEIARRSASDAAAAMKDVDHRLDALRKQLNTLVDRANRALEPKPEGPREAPVEYKTQQPITPAPRQNVTRVKREKTVVTERVDKGPWEAPEVKQRETEHAVESDTAAARHEADLARWEAEAADKTDTLRSQNLIDKYTDFLRKINAFEAAKERWNEYIGRAVPEDPTEAAALARERTKVTPDMLKDVLHAMAEARFAETAYQKARGKVNDMRKSMWDKGPGKEKISLREEPNAEALRQVMREGHVIADSRYATKASRSEPSLAKGRGQRPEASRTRSGTEPTPGSADLITVTHEPKGAESRGAPGGSPANVRSSEEIRADLDVQQKLHNEAKARIKAAGTNPKTVDLNEAERIGKKIGQLKMALNVALKLEAKHGNAKARVEAYPWTQAETAEAPKAEAPKAEAPKAEAPKAEAAPAQTKEERVAANLAAVRAMAAAKKKPDVQHSSTPATGSLTVGEVSSQIAEHFGDTKGKVHVVATDAEMPDRAGGGARAVTLDGNDVYINASKVGPGQVRGLVLHELGVHVGMSGGIIDSLHARLQEMVKNGEEHAGLAAQALAKQQELRAKYPDRTHSEEAVAHFVELAVNKGMVPVEGLAKILKPLTDLVRKVLRTFGLADNKMTAQDIVDFAHGAAMNAIGKRFEDKGGTVQFSRIPKADASYDQAQAELSRQMFKAPTPWAKKIHDFVTGIRYATIDSKDALDKLSRTFGNKVAATQMMYLVRQYEHVNNYMRNILGSGAMEVKSFVDPATGVEMHYVDNVKGAPSAIDIAKVLGNVKGMGNFEFVAQEFKKYLSAKRAAVMEDGYEKLFGKDVTPEQIANLKAMEALGDSMPEFQEARKLYSKYNEGLIDFAVQAGGMSKEMGAALKEGGDYVSWYRVDGDSLNLIVNNEKIGTIGSLKTQPYLRELAGGSSQITGFFEGMIRNTNLLTDIAMRNLATKSVAETLIQMGLARYGKKKAPKNHLQDNVLQYRMKGEDRYAVLDPHALEALGSSAERVIMGMDGVTSQLPAAIKVLGVPAKIFRHFILRTPVMAFKQLVRDSGQNSLMAGVDGIPILRPLANMKRLIENGGALRKEMASKALEGGQVITGTLEDQKTILHEFGSGKMSWGTLMAKLDHASMLADTASRLTAYETAKARGANEIDAIMYAQETMNFTRHGASPSMRMANAVIPFFNAQIQGLDVIYRALRGELPLTERLELRNKLAVRGTMVAAASMMYAAAMKDDEDYKKATTNDRYNSVIVPIPGTDQKLKMPIPFEAGYLFFSLPQMLINYANDTIDGRQAMEAVGSMMLSATPSIIPHGAKPLIEASLNKDFYTGKDIENQHMQGLKMSERFTPTTKELSKKLSGSVEIGGREFGISPVQLEHLVRGYTGGMGMAILGMADGLVTSTTQKPEAQPWNNPIYGQLILNKDLSAATDRAYEYIETMTRAKNTVQSMIKQGRAQDAQEFAGKYAAQIGQAGFAESVRKQLGEFARLKKQIAQVPGDKLTPEKKREMIQNIISMQEQYSRQANEGFRKLEAATQ